MPKSKLNTTNCHCGDKIAYEWVCDRRGLLDLRTFSVEIRDGRLSLEPVERCPRCYRLLDYVWLDECTEERTAA